jgi:hypothetical protein
MNNTAAFRTGIWISVGLAVLDIAGLFTVGMEDAPPTAAILTGAGLGVVTLLAIRPAFRASRTGLAILVASRALSALLSVPAYFTGTSSTASTAVATGFIVLNVLASAFVAPALRSASLRTVQTS